LSKEAQTYDRVQEALGRLTLAIMPAFALVMRRAYGDGWIGHASHVGGPCGLPPVLCPGETIIACWEHFAPTFPPDRTEELRRSAALLAQARAEISKEQSAVDPDLGLRLLEAMRQIAVGFGTFAAADRIEQLLLAQRQAAG
jgi:hypothetical protein